MTRETAIALLNNLRAFAEDDDETAIDMAIEALLDEAYTEQHVRDAFNSGYSCGMEQTKEAIREASSGKD